MVHGTADRHQHHPLLERLSANWWLLLARGIAAVAFGVIALIWPGSALLALALLFGLYAFSDGTLAIFAAFARNAEGAAPTWWLIVAGLLSMAAGIITFGWPGMTVAFLVVLMAVWAILAGLVQIMGAFELRKELDNEWLLMIGGAFSIVAGLFVIAFPGIGALGLVTLIAIYALIFGGLWIVLAFRLRSLHA